MISGAIMGGQLFLLGYGLYALFKARFEVGNDQFIEGARARILGFICLLPLPLSFAGGVVYALVSSATVEEISKSKVPLMIESGILVVVISVVAILRYVFRKSLIPGEIKK